MQDVIGVSPVHPAMLVAGKAGAAVSFSILGLRLAGVDLLGTTMPPARFAAEAAAVAGLTFVALGLVRLREALRVGLPHEESATRLKTTGVYALSRNPMYVGGLLVCAASCVYIPHWLNIAATLVAAVVHHRIILAEERFLERRFGPEWQAYRTKVRRYL